ncbi:helicase C-terminal domain-containing protein, partial [Staphylococcus aureus]|nr:helicase C-terminal domain-containing protein [Staphylococcus aureus]
TSTFKEYVLPDAVTRFRQGLGRLIRNENDRGIIVSFDDRLINSNYKNFFEQALENYRQKKGDIQQFGKLLRQIQKKK